MDSARHQCGLFFASLSWAESDAGIAFCIGFIAAKFRRTTVTEVCNE